MTDLKALAVRAADWINQTPYDVSPRVRCNRTELPTVQWCVSVYADDENGSTLYHTDAEIVECAKAMGWNPEPTADPTPVFPDGIVWKADGPFDTSRAAAVRKALSGPGFASFTPEQRAEAMQAAISFDIHCNPETVITPVVEEDRIALEIRTGTHLTTLNVAGKGGGT